MTYLQRYTTGQVSGMTGITFMSLYRYVKVFNEFFSPQVQKHVRGRRWLDMDVMLAISIQSLFNRRTGEEGIREALKDGWRLDLAPDKNPEVMEGWSSLFETCLVYQEEAKKDRQAAHDLTLKLTQLAKHTRDDHDLLLDLQKAILNQAKEINELYTRKTSFINFGQHQ